MFGQKNGGIILRTYFPGKQKIALLDRKKGKFDAVPPDENMSPGMIIVYNLPLSYSGCPFLSDVEIIEAPMALAKNDILFLHHLLELCYYLIPYGICDTFIFDLVYRAYESLERKKAHNMRYKFLVLFKLLAEVGMYPEDKTYHTPYYYKLAKGPIENGDLDIINDDVEHALNKWVYTCLSSHPCFGNLKTVHFLTAGRGL
ncbi:hypothetical protein HRU45_01070 [Candidatus Dependentiae bacterium]|nr:hypothetical protein [Candidatus Dependentiae bacterium]